jgi:YD repeat-containing protein
VKRLLLSLCAATALATATAAQNQNVAKGFSVDKSYELNDLDQINTFNGALNVNLPIGKRQVVSSSLSYQLIMSYSSNVWKFETDETEYTDPLGNIVPIWVEHAYLGNGVPNTVISQENAGLGWQVSLGRLDIVSDEGGYISPDGARHVFYEALHGESPTTGVGYTRDGSRLRSKTASTTTKIEFPDGSSHTFEKITGRILSIDDQFGNFVHITYAQGLNCASDPSDCAEDWTIFDGFRTHKVDMMRLEPPNVPTGAETYSFDVVKQVVFAGGPVTPAATYTFNYAGNNSLVPISRQIAERQDCRTPDMVLAPILESVTLPDGSKFEFTTDRGDAAVDSQGNWTGKFSSLYGTGAGHLNQTCDAYPPIEVNPVPSGSGFVKKLKRPTGGVTEWTMQPYAFPVVVPSGKPNCLDVTTCSFGISGRSATGVKDRYEWNGTVLTSKKTYEHQLVAGDNTASTSIKTYDQVANGVGALISKSVHYYRVPWTRNDALRPEYGLPFTRGTQFWPATETQADSDGRFISSKLYDGADNLLQYSYVAYESEPASVPSVDDASVNRRVKSERVVYLDAAGAITNSLITLSSDYDGLGHYRTVTTTTGNSVSPAINRTVTTLYNAPDSQTDPSAFSSTSGSNFVPYPSGRLWILDTYASQRVVEAGKSTKTLCLFDNVGFLARRRTLKQTTLANPLDASDLVAVFTQSGGNVTSEAYYGGDAQALASSGTLAALTLPGSPVTSVVHTYTAGALKTSKYGAPIAFFSTNREIDPATGLATMSTDPAGVSTRYEYDASGRLIWSLPQATNAAATEYLFSAPSTSSPAKVTINQRATKGSPVLTTASVQYDEFGRVTLESRAMPNGGTSSRQTLYDGRGKAASISEWGNLAAKTSFTYDSLGRPLTTTAPDGKATTFLYGGMKTTQRSSTVATSATGSETLQTSTEKVDDLGRLFQVIEPGGTTTTYGYDVGGQLSSVNMVDGTTTQLPRTFAYDGRGFLTFEEHPESGRTTYKYDARGHVIERTAAATSGTPRTVAFEYDAAERLQRVSEGALELKLFTFDRPNTAVDKSMGKLASALRHNRVPSEGDIIVTETYKYEEPNGRPSAKTTSLSSGESFTDSYAYDALGAITSITYPTCTNCGLQPPARTVTNTYDRGWLTGVPQYTPTSGITYAANGSVASVKHLNANGTSGPEDTYEQDATGMARPARITLSTFCNDLSVSALSSKTVSSGSTSNLSAAASGATSYQWWELLGNGTNQIVSGQTTAVLDVTVTASRRFWVRVGNGSCTVDSNVATVDVNACAAPSATITAPSSVPRNGAPATASVTSTPGATYAWSISSGGTISSGSTASSVTFTAACNTSSVTLTVVVTASCGSQNSASQVVATGPASTATLSTSGSTTIVQGDSKTITVTLTGASPWTVTWSDGAAPWSGSATSFTRSVTPLGTTSYSVTVTDANGCATTSSQLTITVTPPAPGALAATATSATQVQLAWTFPPSGSADSFEVQRRAPGGTFVADGSTTATTLLRPANANTAYLYRVRSIKAGTASAWSAVDLATTTMFTDDPTSASVVIKAEHIMQLRTAVNAVRALWNSALAPATFADATLSGVNPKVVHVQELRNVLAEARNGLGLTVWSFTDPTLTAGSSFKAVHVNDLRGGVR